MKGIPEVWEVVSRKINRQWIMSILMLIPELILDVQHLTILHSSATWTVRRKSTGVTKRVTANSESEAADKIAKGWFDADEVVAEK